MSNKNVRKQKGIEYNRNINRDRKIYIKKAVEME